MCKSQITCALKQGMKNRINQNTVVRRIKRLAYVLYVRYAELHCISNSSTTTFGVSCILLKICPVTFS